MPLPPHVDSYYVATAPGLPEHPALAGRARADVCVVGGGFTGLSVALELAERGYDVALLEAARLGWGASGRNGGQISGGLAAGMDKVEAWVGREDARRLFWICEEAKAIIAERVERHGIACDLVWSHLTTANKPRHMEGLRRQQRLWAELGYPHGEIVERADLGRHIDSPAYAGGLYDAGSGHLHPLNYCLGLARAAAAAGVRLYEASPVRRIERGGGRPKAMTEAGEVEAATLVLCGNAYMDALVPALRRKIMPVGTYIGATAPLGAERARGLLPTNAAVTDCNFVLDYFRLSADRRLLFGGRVSYSTVMPPDLPRAMRAKMLRVFPQLSDVGFDYTWGGYVAITMERTPHLGRLGGDVYFAHGFSGHGVALTGVAGRILAEAVAGQHERLDLFARLPHTTFPGGRLMRTPLLALAMLYYRLHDLLP